MNIVKLTSKGRLTVPASIRKKLGIDAGDYVLFYEHDGQVIIVPATSTTLCDMQVLALRQHVYTLGEIRKIAIPIAERHQLQRLALFGAYARGEASCESDLEFYAEVSKDFGLFRLGAVINDLEDAFHKKVDLITPGMLADLLSDALARRIVEDEVLLYVAEKPNNAEC